jgi:CheY-like chemotaxis protein
MRSAGQRQSQASLLSTFVDVLYKPIRLSRLQRVLVDSIGADTGKEGEFEPRTDELDRCIARVLLVEDSIVNQKVVARMLEKLGCWVDVAANGSEAVVAFERFPYDAVLMDIHMPEMDGFQAAEAIRRLEKASRRGRTPIVAMTASVTARDREECLAAGMDDYMPKPVVRSVLSETLQRWIGHEEGTLAPAGL